MKKVIKIATRASELALCQTNFVKERLERLDLGLKVEIEIMSTKGDRILDVPLAKIGGKGLFTKELEESLLNERTDIAVHSLKDMPVFLPKGLVIGAYLPRLEPRDAFLSLKYKSFDDLPTGARIGTSSLRRSAQLLRRRQDLSILSLRGNVNTRIRKLEDDEYDAIILASAGLIRLGRMEHIKEIIPFEKALPAIGQGILAVEVREKNETLKKLLSLINDEESETVAMAERSFLARVDGGCQAPIAAFADFFENSLRIRGFLSSLDGKDFLYGEKIGEKRDAVKIGTALAEELLNKGGKKLLQEIGLCRDGK